MSPEAFVAELDGENRRALDRIAQASCAGEPSPELTVTKLLLLALKNELEATECASAWIATTPEVSVKLALARQAGDEAKHYRLIQKRLTDLGVDTTNHDPFAGGAARSPLLAYLVGLEGTVARVAAGQFTREALALVRNAEFTPARPSPSLRRPPWTPSSKLDSVHSGSSDSVDRRATRRPRSSTRTSSSRTRRIITSSVADCSSSSQRATRISPRHERRARACSRRPRSCRKSRV